MDPERKGLLDELRGLSVPTKQKIMIFSTIIAMVLVIYLWMAYFNTIVVPGAPSDAVVASVSPVASGTSGDNVDISGLFSTAVGSLWGVAGNFERSIGGMLKNPKQYSINPNQ